MVIMLEKIYILLKYDKILMIFKFSVSQIYPIVMLPDLKITYDKIDRTKTLIRAIYCELVIFLQKINYFRYIPDNESVGGILGWN